tara:strand:- start:111 stop:485 length:375 start_codon:yes stop_codon:yes gene_type:complete
MKQDIQKGEITDNVKRRSLLIVISAIYAIFLSTMSTLICGNMLDLFAWMRWSLFFLIIPTVIYMEIGMDQLIHRIEKSVDVNKKRRDFGKMAKSTGRCPRMQKELDLREEKIMQLQGRLMQLKK